MINMQLIIKIIFVTSNTATYFFVMNKINELYTKYNYNDNINIYTYYI